MSVLIKGLEMPETEYMDVRIFQDGTATIATGKKPYYRELKAEPVRHGKWIEGKCNRCGEHAPFWSMASTYYRSNYCPNCGARMDAK